MLKKVRRLSLLITFRGKDLVKWAKFKELLMLVVAAPPLPRLLAPVSDCFSSRFSAKGEKQGKKFQNGKGEKQQQGQRQQQQNTADNPDPISVSVFVFVFLFFAHPGCSVDLSFPYPIFLSRNLLSQKIFFGP